VFEQVFLETNLQIIKSFGFSAIFKQFSSRLCLSAHRAAQPQKPYEGCFTKNVNSKSHVRGEPFCSGDVPFKLHNFRLQRQDERGRDLL